MWKWRDSSSARSADYRKSPLEEMAYSLQHRFDREAQAFSVEATCQKLLGDKNK
jgi:hypothetical protein